MRAIIGGSRVVISDDDLRRISEENPGWQFERSDDGALLVSPTSTNGGAKSGEAFAQLHAYAKLADGKAYDAGTGFKTPAGGIVSPDASWISAERVALHRHDDGFWSTMPDIVIEVASKSDTWDAVTGKIDAFERDGASYAIAIDPGNGATYERGLRPEDLTLDIGAIVDA
jgi:Uma2 family endonuclease